MKQKTRFGYPLVGLALGGGSARGIAHIGVLQVFIEHGIPIDRIAGTSAGAIVAAGYAFGASLEKMGEKAKKLSWYTLANIPRSPLGLVSNQSLEKMMEEFVGAADIDEAKVPLAIVATDIENGERVVIRKGKASLAVRASACIPGLFTPVEIGGRKLVDGELAEPLPLAPLREMGADILIAVNVIPRHMDRKVNNVLDVMSNVVDILSNHQRNRLVREVAVLIEPDLGAYGPSDFKKAEELIAAGRRAAMEKMPEIKRALVKAGVPLKTGEKSMGFFARFWRWLTKG